MNWEGPGSVGQLECGRGHCSPSTPRFVFDCKPFKYCQNNREHSKLPSLGRKGGDYPQKFQAWSSQFISKAVCATPSSLLELTPGCAQFLFVALGTGQWAWNSCSFCDGIFVLFLCSCLCLTLKRMLCLLLCLVLNSVFGVSSNITKPYLFNSYGLPTKNPGYCSLAGIPGYRMLAFCQETAIHRFPVERAWLLNKSFCHVHVPIVSFSCAGKHVKASWEQGKVRKTLAFTHDTTLHEVLYN